jgi:decaprenylphospho-beta-D-ribofuranose 2-oxidase
MADRRADGVVDLTVPDPRLLHGWGRTSPTSATVRPVTHAAQAAALLAGAGPRGVIARGLGRSYGDAAQNAGGLVLDMTGFDGSIELDPSTGTVTCDAGVSLDALLRVLLPAGWFVPVTPGTRQVTLGGAVAADVHGKNHHRDGSIGQHISSLDLLTGDGEVRTVGPDQSPDLFWATTGGMGLTGVILRVSLRLVPVETSWMLVDTERAPDLDAVLAGLRAADQTFPYTVAWVDCLSRGRSLGRGVLTSGSHAPVSALPARAQAEPRAFDGGLGDVLPSLPRVFPSGLMRRESAMAFNELWFRKAPRHKTDQPQRLGAFFHPLDALHNWNRLYGPRGFLQYQLVVPDDASPIIESVIGSLAAAGTPGLLAVLKRFGAANLGPLSFPTAGWTLALDLPAGAAGLADLLDGFDQQVAVAGGRVYLAKDSRLRPELLSTMYPRLDEWREVRAKADPHDVFRSDLSRRLSL